MANLSDAQGTITLKADNYEALVALYDSYDPTMYGDYSTYLSRNSNIKQDACYDENAKIWYFTTDFCAVGRWSYYTNIESHGYWMRNAMSNKELELLDNSWWKVEAEYVDKECGCELLCEATIVLEHEKETNTEEAKIVREEVEYYPYDWVNLVKLGFYEDFRQLVIEEYDDDYCYGYSDFIKNKDSLIKYCGLKEKWARDVAKALSILDIYEEFLKWV